MDEFEGRRRRREERPDGAGKDSQGQNDQDSDQPVASPEEELAERAETAQGDDHVAQVRDVEAAGDDSEAIARDYAAEERDAEAAERDKAASVAAYPPSQFADRRRARADRADAAEDRARAAEDRDRARSDRQVSEQQRERAGSDRSAAYAAVGLLRELLVRAEDEAEHMSIIGQAQGMIMAELGCGPLDALLELTTRAVRDHSELEAAARSIIRDQTE